MILLFILIMLFLSSNSDEEAYRYIMSEREAERRKDEIIYAIEKQNDKRPVVKISRKTKRREIKDSTGRVLCEEIICESMEGISI